MNFPKIDENGNYVLNNGYTSILELDKKLTEENIPHQLSRCFDGWIITYPNYENRIFDVIEHFASYGHDSDLMEAYGGGIDDVDGYLDAENALTLFRNLHMTNVGVCKEQMKVPKINWIPFDRKNPPSNLHDEQLFLILLREDNYNNGATWTYSVDVATPYGSYLDNFWNTDNDWDEGQRIEVLAYAEMPCYLKEEELVEADDF